MKIATRPTYFATGAQHERDLAAVQMGPVAFDAMLAGGPLDAPCYVPAGAHNSFDVTDWRGRSMPAETLSRREPV